MDQHLDYEYLNSCRILSGLTNKAIAAATNISEPSISRFFHGEMKDPSALMLCAVCDTIGASIDRAYGVIKPIDQSMTEPTPSIPAVVTDVVQSLPPLIDEKQVAKEVAKAVVDSPLLPSIDAKELARAIAAELPAPAERECASCRTARLYEASIARQSKLISVLFAALGAMVTFVIVLAVWLLAK